jgi:hypothetical protein
LRNHLNAGKRDTGAQFLLRNVLESLGLLRAESALEMLAMLLQNGFRQDIVGKDFVKSVLAIHSPQTQAFFKPFLKSSKPEVRLTALQVLIPLMPAKDLSGYLLNIITNNLDWGTQIEAIKLLNEVLCSELGIELVRFLGRLSIPPRDQNMTWCIRRELVNKLISVGDADLLPELRKLFDSTDDPEIQDMAHFLIYVINQKIGNRWIWQTETGRSTNRG